MQKDVLRTVDTITEDVIDCLVCHSYAVRVKDATTPPNGTVVITCLDCDASWAEVGIGVDYQDVDVPEVSQ